MARLISESENYRTCIISLIQFFRVAFFKSAFAFLDSATYVELYFPFVATSPSLLTANGGSADTVVGTGSCLFNDDGSISAVGELLV